MSDAGFYRIYNAALCGLGCGFRCVYGVKGFEGWASELGYDTDSRSAKRAYDNCVKGAAALKRTLGDAEYERLLYDVESL